MLALTAQFWNVVWIVLAVNLMIMAVGYPILVGYILFSIMLKRSSPEKWGRTCSSDNPEQLEMYAQGMDWHADHVSYAREVDIVNEGMHLYGEFYDQGSDRTVMIMPGRSDSMCASYFFAEPYWENGYNVFVYDPRSHGKSDGKYNTVGFEEHKDLMAWMEFLRQNCHTQSVVLHGICVGTCSGLLALESGKCPVTVRALVTEGIFSTFYESFKNHMIERKKPRFLILPCVDIWLRLHTGHSMRYGPEQVLPKISTPLLMLHCRQDPYSLPHTAQELFDASASENKQLVWFPEGNHSRLRMADRVRYDAAITEFLKTI